MDKETRDYLDTRFATIDTHFKAIDTRFEAIDTHFDAIDTRFEAIDTRFEAIDRRFAELEEFVGTAIDGHTQQFQNQFDAHLRLITAINDRLSNLEHQMRDIGTRLDAMQAEIAPPLD